MNNFYLIDKPLNCTSFDVIRILRKKFDIKKMGHTGTLDPLATGCLFIATGNYTKLIPFFEKDKKTYEFELTFGARSESLDLGTPLIETDPAIVSENKKKIDIKYLEELLQSNFSGEIEQLPPKYSALKIGGKKALELVRAGVDFEMKKRKVTVYSIKILDYSFPKLKLSAEVSAGTYIRTIAADIGEITGLGAYVSELRRTSIGKLHIDSAQNLESVTQDDFMPIKQIFPSGLFITVPTTILEKLNQGLRIKYSLEKDDGTYFIMNDKGITNVINYINGELQPLKKIMP